MIVKVHSKKERFWVKFVKKINKNEFIGIIDNYLIHNFKGKNYGDRAIFKFKNLEKS